MAAIVLPHNDILYTLLGTKHLHAIRDERCRDHRFGRSVKTQKTLGGVHIDKCLGSKYIRTCHFGDCFSLQLSEFRIFTESSLLSTIIVVHR